MSEHEPRPGQMVGDLSEGELLERIFPLLPAGAATLVGPGDDAAVVAAPDGRFVVSTDVLVEDRHFRRAWSSGEDVGARAAAQNLIDVAAMGARPTSLVVSLVVPDDLPVAWVTGFARGLARRCSEAGAAVVGGDLSSGDAIVVAVTVHGDLDGRAPVLRGGAQVGDVVAHSGVRGWSAAGLALLERLGTDARARGDGVAGLVAQFRAPRPPVADGPLAAAEGARAMLDVSDGLLRDAGRLARASGVQVDLERAAFRPDDDRLEPAAQILEPHDAARRAELVTTWVLGGGEDHGLLATFPAGTPASALPGGFRPVGRVRSLSGPTRTGSTRTAAVRPVLVDGLAPTTTVGWDHFGRGQGASRV